MYRVFPDFGDVLYSGGLDRLFYLEPHGLFGLDSDWSAFPAWHWDTLRRVRENPGFAGNTEVRKLILEISYPSVFAPGRVGD